MVMFNPVIVKKSGSYKAEEGCLSLTGTRYTKRFQTIMLAEQVDHEVRALEGLTTRLTAIGA